MAKNENSKDQTETPTCDRERCKVDVVRVATDGRANIIERRSPSMEDRGYIYLSGGVVYECAKCTDRKIWFLSAFGDRRFFRVPYDEKVPLPNPLLSKKIGRPLILVVLLLMFSFCGWAYFSRPTNSTVLAAPVSDEDPELVAKIVEDVSQSVDEPYVTRLSLSLLYFPEVSEVAEADAVEGYTWFGKVSAGNSAFIKTKVGSRAGQPPISTNDLTIGKIYIAQDSLKVRTKQLPPNKHPSNVPSTATIRTHSWIKIIGGFYLHNPHPKPHSTFDVYVRVKLLAAPT